MSRADRVCLLTGARGFLGSYTSSVVRDAGFDVRDTGDIRLPSPEIDAVMERVAPELVIHLGGPASVANSFSDPGADFRGCVAGTASLLDSVRRHAPRARVVYVSSAAVYGCVDDLPVSEDAPVRPISPYGFHRAMAEQLVDEAARIFGIWTATARVFSAFGVGLRRQVIYDLCSRAARDGSLVLDGDGTESRDFIHAHDVARALLTIALEARGAGERYNVASGIEVSIKDVADAIASTFGLPAPEFTNVRRRGDPPRWRAEIGKLVGLGFQIKIPWIEGLGEVANWVQTERVRAGGNNAK